MSFGDAIMFSYSHRWYDDEQTILLYEIECKTWTWDDAHEVVAHQVELMQTVEHAVHTIFNFKNSPSITTRGLRSNLRELMGKRAPNEALSIFVGVNFQFLDMMSLVARMLHIDWLLGDYRFVDSIPAALEEITRYERKQKKEESAA